MTDGPYSGAYTKASEKLKLNLEEINNFSSRRRFVTNSIEVEGKPDATHIKPEM